MKQKFLLISLSVLMCISFYGCKKDSSSSITSGSSQWAFNGTTYYGTMSWLNAPLLTSSDDLGYQIGINFDSAPTSNGTYKVVAASPGVSECTLFLSRSETSENYYSSTGEAGNIVRVTITGGKITAGFSNIIVAHITGGTTKTVSGTLIEK